MKSLLSFAVALILIVPGLFAAEQQPNYAELPWTELDQSSFEPAIANELYTVVLFYSEKEPGKEYPIEILRKIEGFAEDLQVTAAYAKINVDKNKHIVQHYKITKLPTIALFIDRKHIKFTKELTPDALEQWLNHLINRQLYILDNSEDFEYFRDRDEKSKLLAIFPKEGMIAEKQLLERLLMEGRLLDNDIISVGIASNADIINTFFPNETYSPSLCLIKSFESPVPVAVFKGNLSNAEEIREFISLSNLPIVIEFEEDTISRLFQGYVKNHIYLFLPNKSESFAPLLQEFKKSAEYNFHHDLYYERIYHVLFYANDLYEDIQMNFGLNNLSRLPAVFITELRGQALQKYQFNPNEEINYENLKNFIEAFRAKNLTLYRPSEDIPAESSQGFVRRIVEKSFKKEVIQSNYSIQVLFCNDLLENPVCTLAQKIFDAIAQKLKESESTLRLGIIDSFRNEVENFDLGGAGAEIYLFVKGIKHKPKKFEFILTYRALVAWMNTVSAEVSLRLTQQDEDTFIKTKLTEQEQSIILINRERLGIMKVNLETGNDPNEPPKMLGAPSREL